MTDTPNLSKRSILAGAVIAGAVASLGTPQAARAQLLDNGIDPKSVLAKVKKGGTLQVGYAPAIPWTFKDAKSGQLRGVYKELVDKLAADLEMAVSWREVTFADSTVALRRGDYDLFGSSAVYTPPRALVSAYIGPLWSKGTLCVVRKQDADKYKTAADFNSPDVTFSVNAGSSEELRMPQLFPKAKFISVNGQQGTMAAEPVRVGQATVYASGDIDILVLAKRNPGWAHIVDPANPFDKRPSTWLVRHGDPSWKSFLDFWALTAVGSGDVQRLYDQYLQELT